MEGDVKSTKNDVSELKKLAAQWTKKADSLEKEVQGVKILLEELQKTVKSGGGQLASGTTVQAARHPSSSEVSSVSIVVACMGEGPEYGELIAVHYLLTVSLQ